MSFRTTVRGRLEQRVVDGGTVDALLQSNGDLINFRTWLFFFLGADVEALVTLASGVKHPELVYGAILVFSALAAGTLYLERRETARAAQRRIDLEATGRQFTFETSPMTGAQWSVQISGGQTAPPIQGPPDRGPEPPQAGPPET